jgi:hypothetical protein
MCKTKIKERMVEKDRKGIKVIINKMKRQPVFAFDGDTKR